MKPSIILVLPLVLWGPAAVAAGAEGNGALSLAALVAEHSPSLTRAEKNLLRAYLYGPPKTHLPAGDTIVVKADDVTCRISNVDITHKDCTLAFGARTAALDGRQAHELYATLIEAGVPSTGAAGSVHRSVKNLECAISPAEVQQEGGAGARCKFLSSN